MNKEKKKSDKTTFGKQTESMYIIQLFEIKCPKFTYQILPTANS